MFLEQLDDAVWYLCPGLILDWQHSGNHCHQLNTAALAARCLPLTLVSFSPCICKPCFGMCADKEVAYKGAEVNDVQLAWASTIHKAQGSECPVVVLVLSPQHRPLLTRRLLYTGVFSTLSRLACLLCCCLVLRPLVSSHHIKGLCSRDGSDTATVNFSLSLCHHYWVCYLQHADSGSTSKINATGTPNPFRGC